MPRTLMPTPEDPRPDVQALRVADPLDPEAQAVLDFLRGEYVAAPRGSAPTNQPGAAPPRPAQPEPADCEPTRHDSLVYLPAASARVVRRVVGLFGEADCAEAYARDGGYHLYDVVPATAVIPKTP